VTLADLVPLCTREDCWELVVRVEADRRVEVPMPGARLAFKPGRCHHTCAAGHREDVTEVSVPVTRRA
jgi:hypothetical protein